MQKLKGRITISRYASTADEGSIHIIVEDKLSGCRTIDVTISMLDYAKLITGQGYIDCDFDFIDSGFIGMTRESKHILLSRPADSIYDRGEEIRYYEENVLPEHEIDGWKVRMKDIFNCHNYAADNKVEVLFERWVKSEEKDNG